MLSTCEEMVQKKALRTPISKHWLLWLNVFVTCLRYLSVPESYVLQVYDNLSWFWWKWRHSTHLQQLHTQILTHNSRIHADTYACTHALELIAANTIFFPQSQAQIINIQEHRNQRWGWRIPYIIFGHVLVPCRLVRFNVVENLYVQGSSRRTCRRILGQRAVTHH